MTQRATHTHKTRGGRFALLAHYNGDVTLDTQMIIVYRDLDHECDTATTAKDWESNWRAIDPDDCTICLGSGTDQIKGAKHKPCGGCYGLGKVKADGETPANEWEVADVARGIIQRQRTALQRLATLDANPEVQALLKRQHDASVAENDQKWRDGRGRGPGGRRFTGD